MSPAFQLHGAPIFLGPLAEAFPVWFENQSYSKVFALCDENTRRLCLPYFLEQTGLSGKVHMVEILAGEAEKNLVTCEKIWSEMLAAKLDRKALAVNLGGGVLGDMGGFCAATWKRGIDFVQIPTTLLSMTDAAIGGKTGVDFQGIKNAIGVFRQPAAVFVDPFFLHSLPEREWRSGLAEVVKHALIGDLRLRDRLTLSQTISSSTWTDILQKSIAVKVRIVQEDPCEKGLRMLLNFGHTVGHALESWSLETGEPLTHGEAVAIGMICEIPDHRKAGIADLLMRHFPHRHIPKTAFPALWGLMQQDKKNSSGTVRVAVPDEAPFSLKTIGLTQAEFERSLAYYNVLG